MSMANIKNNIVSLIGMTGCGKTTVGRIIAGKIGAALIDLDEEIVSRHGEIKKIFGEQGEEAFRQIEYETLKSVINSSEGKFTILSCGGGLPTYKESRELLASSTTVVWLRRSAESVTADKTVLMRPPVNGDINNYKRLLDLRYPIYRSCAEYSFYNAFPKRTAVSVMKKLHIQYKSEELK